MWLTVETRDLRDSFAHWLRRVRRGEVVIVLERGQPVAVLSAVDAQASARAEAEYLAGLAARGLVSLGSGRTVSRPRRLPRVNLSEAVLAERGERP